MGANNLNYNSINNNNNITTFPKADGINPFGTTHFEDFIVIFIQDNDAAEGAIVCILNKVGMQENISKLLQTSHFIQSKFSLTIIRQYQYRLGL